LCSFCKTDDETRIHFFNECEIVTEFWNLFVNWWSTMSGENVILSKRSIMLGYKPQECETNNIIKLFNQLIILAKHFIYYERKNNRLNFVAFLQNVKLVKSYEKELYKRRDKTLLFLEKWTVINI
jgi:hypothetical protein